MKITAIKRQIRQQGRYSIFLEGKYVFSLGEAALLEAKLVSGQELSPQQVKEFKQLSVDDKLYSNTLRYLAIRQRSEWEIKSYLQRKNASPSLSETILNKLSNIGLINDKKFAEVFVSSRRASRSTSQRKLKLELQQKRISSDLIEQVIHEEEIDEQATLLELIAKKRHQSRYQDDLKLMQYLVRQGFNYGDVKDALKKINT